MKKNYNYKIYNNISVAMSNYNAQPENPKIKFNIYDLNLLCLIKSFNDSGNKFYMTYDELASHMMCSSRNIINSANKLIALGLISKQKDGPKVKYLKYCGDAVSEFIRSYNA